MPEAGRGVAQFLTTVLVPGDGGGSWLRQGTAVPGLGLETLVFFSWLLGKAKAVDPPFLLCDLPTLKE